MKAKIKHRETESGCCETMARLSPRDIWTIQKVGWGFAMGLIDLCRGMNLHSSFALCAAGKIQDPLQPLVIKEEVEGPNIALLAKRVRLEVAVVCVQVALLQLDGLIDGCPEALEKGAVAETRCLLPDLEESKTCPRDRRGKGKEHGISNEAVTHASTESKQTFPIPDESAGVSPCARISIRTRETSSSWLSMLSSTSLRVRSLRKWWARSWLKS
mmetsp:Transcript_16572/g.39334  ORF Transcript_16572/g.39334 Transcript_16572/m.39334 type:complete len:215 (-) Transcript_16572:106-750(-)